MKIKCRRCRAVTEQTVHFLSMNDDYAEIQCKCPKCNRIYYAYMKVEKQLKIAKD